MHLKEASVALLHNEIYKICREYLNRGWVSVSELDNLEYLWSGYKELGGNGTGELLYTRVSALEIRED